MADRTNPAIRNIYYKAGAEVNGSIPHPTFALLVISAGCLLWGAAWAGLGDGVVRDAEPLASELRPRLLAGAARFGRCQLYGSEVAQEKRVVLQRHARTHSLTGRGSR